MSVASRRLRRLRWPTVPKLIAANQSVFPDKRVWAHAVAHGMPDYSNWNPDSYYGELYPLELVEGDYRVPRRVVSGVARMREAGINALTYMLFSGDPGDNIANEFVVQADPTWNDPDPANHFMLAPTIYGELTVAEIEHLIREYAAFAVSHPSCARIGDKLVIWVYASQGHSASEWAQIRANVADLPLFFVGDLGIDGAVHGYQIEESRITPLFPYFDASYVFEDSLDHFWPATVEYVNRNSRAYAGGTMPGYNRDNVDAGGFIDADGTKLYRRLLEAQFADNGKWQCLVTWDDLVEHSEVRATSMWNKTRADVSAFYSAKFIGRAFPRPNPELYITTPTYVYATADAIKAEAMVINGGKAPVKVTVQLYDDAGNAFGQAVSNICYPTHTADATTSSSLYAGTAMVGKWLRARAQMFDANNVLLQSVTSAPIIVYPNGLVASTRLRRLYQSIPAYAALPVNPTLSLSGSPVDGAVTATVLAPDGMVPRFSEVLQNTRLAGIGYGKTSFQTAVPMGQKQYLATTTTSLANGYYVGRIIDEQERVGYSDPLYFA